MPAGADAVVMVEETEKAGDDVRVLTPVYPRQNVGRQGADIVVGQTVIARGDVLNPSRIGALAALGVADVEVFAKPTVAILSTGNEIADPGQELKPGQIYDINKFTLSTIIAEHGGVPMPFATAQDTIEALEARDRCVFASCDVLVFSGGSSVGERDLILDVIGRKGEIVFHGIAVKPGKPTVFGTINGKPMFGMPGYPTSCLSNAYMLLVPALREMARLKPRHLPTVVVAARPADCLDHRPPSVLHRAHRRRPGDAGVQGLRRHHLDVAGRRLHRNPRPDRHRRKGRSRRGQAVLIIGTMEAVRSSGWGDQPTAGDRSTAPASAMR